MGSSATKRSASINTATLFFAVFGVLAILVGVIDLVKPIYPWGLRLPVLGHVGGVKF